MAGAFLQEAQHAAPYTHGAHRYALGAPCPSVLVHEQFGYLQYSVQVVQGFALSHEHDVREPVPFWQGVYLVQYVGGGKVSLETLSACHAEPASHAASHLAAYAQGATVLVGDEDTLHRVSRQGGEEVLGRTVHTALCLHSRHQSHAVLLCQQGAGFLGDVCHLLNISDMLLVYPAKHLLGGKGGKARVGGHFLQFLHVHTQQWGACFLVHNAGKVTPFLYNSKIKFGTYR